MDSIWIIVHINAHVDGRNILLCRLGIVSGSRYWYRNNRNNIRSRLVKTIRCGKGDGSMTGECSGCDACCTWLPVAPGTRERGRFVLVIQTNEGYNRLKRGVSSTNSDGIALCTVALNQTGWSGTFSRWKTRKCPDDVRENSRNVENTRISYPL